MTGLFDPRTFDEDAFLAGPDRYASWDGEDSLVDVDPVFAKSFGRIWNEQVGGDPGSVAIAADARRTPALAAPGYHFVDVPAGVLLLDAEAKPVGGYLGCDLAIEPNHRGLGLGAELVLEYALRHETIPVWQHDIAAFSPAGEAAHRSAYRLAHKPGLLACKRAAFGFTDPDPMESRTTQATPGSPAGSRCPADLPALLYHGTSDGYLDQILRDGLDPRSSVERYLCYTDDVAIARHHANHMAEHDSAILGKACRAVIFAIPMTRFERAGFCLDRNFVRLGPSHGRAVGQQLGHRRWTWEELLAHAGAVGYAHLLRVEPSNLISEDPTPDTVSLPD